MRFVAVGLVALASCLAQAKGAAFDWKQVKDQVAAGIVRVHVVHEDREHLKPYRPGELSLRRGTGFFIDGYRLVTNQHVVEGARTIKVEGVGNKEKFSMRYAARPSVRFDLALLQFTSDAERARFERVNGPIRALEWAQWEDARPGGPITVLGFGHSEKLVATQGIISNWEPRHDLFQRRLDHVTLIRTDAAVNPGNSGGPAIGPRGTVIGVSARYGAGENIGLLIPFSTARQVVSGMRADGEFTKTDPGFIGYNLNPVLRKTLSLSPEQQGLVISHVLPDSPARRADLRQWDVVAAVNGHAIEHGEVHHPVIGKVPFWFLFNTAEPGDALSLDVIRSGAAKRVELVMSPTTVPRIWLPTEGDDYPLEWGYLGGLIITEVTRDLLEEVESGGNWRWDLVNDAPRDGKLYMVTSIEPETQAMSYQEYGLDLLQLRVLALNGEPVVGSLTERLEALYAAVKAGTAPEFVTVDLEKHISIQLETARLAADRVPLEKRYPLVSRQLSRGVATATGPSQGRSSPQSLRSGFTGARGNQEAAAPDVYGSGNGPERSRGVTGTAP